MIVDFEFNDYRVAVRVPKRVIGYKKWWLLNNNQACCNECGLNSAESIQP
jgi:hypothetical protein